MPAKKKYHTTDEQKEAYRRRAREYTRRVRRASLAAYGNKCACCEEDRHEFLAIDHIHGDGAEHRRQIGRSTAIHRWLAKNGYPDGFQVLCHNCNSAKAYYGYCPHQGDN